VLDSIAVYFGLLLVFVGLVSLLRPLRFLRIRTRRAATIVAAGGLVLTIIALALPVPTQRVTTPITRLDDWMPAWQFDEMHTIHVDAPPEKAFAAIRAVRPDEIRFFRTLIAIRRCGQSGPESILNAPEQKPLLDVATETTFIYLADEPPRELVVGTVVVAPPKARASGKLTPEIFQKTLPPGVVLATMNFLVTPDEHGGSIVSSETRVYANSAPAVRRFAVYWCIIHPGSDIIRRMWLRAIKLRAEEKPASPAGAD
jgi:hypothetical protein